VAAYATSLVLFGLVVIGWCADRFNLKRRIMWFRITTKPCGQRRNRSAAAFG